MDYGKMAYAGLQELESYVRRSAQQKENRGAAVKSAYPHAAFDGGYEPCTLTGVGCVGLTVTLELRAPQGAENVRVKLYCGGKLTSYANVKLGAGEAAQYTLTGAVYPSDGEAIKVVAESDDLILDGISVYAEGNGVALTGGGDGYKCDESEGEAFTVHEDVNGYAVITKASDGKSADAAHGSVFDIAAVDGIIHVVVSDDNGNLWGVCYDCELNELSRKFLGEGAERVAVAQSHGGIKLAAVRNRKIYFAECGKLFCGLTDWLEADFETDADSVYLSKQTADPVLFFARGGSLYAKLPEQTARAYDCVSVKISVNMSE